MRITSIVFFFALVSIRLGAADIDEFKVKRQDVFEFTQKPTLTRQGTSVTIAFESKGYCDATIALEDMQGKIVRHLASGVLGPKAPEPFQRNSLRQTIVWDGKNDRGEYLKEAETLTVRVSLGLKPAFERNLFWEPKRRHGWAAPKLQVTQEGVYIYEGGNGFDYVKLYGHDGQYTKTIYPFPGNKIEQVNGLKHTTYPDGQTLPVKATFLQQTFLTCGNLHGREYPKKYAIDSDQADGGCHYGMYGYASSILAVNAGRLALGKTYLNRFATDGSSGGMEFEGPAVALPTTGKAWDNNGLKISAAPRSAALSPDGKTLYLTAYLFCHFGRASADIVGGGTWEAFHCVLKMDLDGDKPPSLFAGNMEVNKSGSDNKSFNAPASVAVDKEGRVYVADFRNDRVQIFGADGSLLKSIGVTRPAIVSIASKSQEIYVFSSLVYTPEVVQKQEKVDCQLTVFNSFDSPNKKLSCKLPEGMGASGAAGWYSGIGLPLSAVVDDFASPPTIWFANEWARENVLTRGRITYSNVELFTLENGQLKAKRSFATDVAKSVKRSTPAPYGRSRLYVNPGNGHVYVCEGEAYDGKSFKNLLELDPETGSIEVRPIPFDAEDMCFDNDGHVYLRSINTVARYDPTDWREVPWDYGDERNPVYTSSSSDRKEAALISGLPLPCDCGWHQGGLYVSLQGNLVVSCGLQVQVPTSKYETGNVIVSAVPYRPAMYPGRCVQGRAGAPLMHIWDQHGKMIATDILPGLGGAIYGLGLDRDNNVYLMSSNTRVLDGKTYQNQASGTIIKVVPGKAKMLSQGATPIPLADSDKPKRPVDLQSAPQGVAWIDGAEWMYGGVGFDGKNYGQGCGCWNARFAFDYFGRSFAPELHRFSVAVLDCNGNLILRVGRYGNADSAGPQSGVPLGNDEVGMVHGAYVATHTDRRLFIADPSNDRIFSVKLGYHAEEKIPLKSAKDDGLNSSDNK
jgi:hypothetical protein